MLEVRCSCEELLRAVESFLRSRGIEIKRSMYGDCRLIVYRLGFFKKLVIEYDPYSEVAVIKCRDGKLLADLEIALRRALGSWSVELKTREQCLASDTVSTLLRKAIERKVLLNKAKYSRRFLCLYLSMLLISTLLSLFLSLLIPIALAIATIVLVLLIVPHDRGGSQRFSINPGEVFLPVLYPWYRKRLKEVKRYIERYLPLLSEEERRYVEMALNG